MSSTNDIRISTSEGAMTFISDRLAHLLLEVDSRLTGRGMFIKFIRSGGLIQRVEYYRDEAKTNLAISRDYDRVSGTTGLILINDIETKYYEEDGTTVDSIVSGFMDRDLTVSGTDFVDCCSGFFSTTESEKL